MTSALRCLVLWLMCLVPTMGMAQASVQAGEHESFTRVVTQLPGGAAWSAQQQGRIVSISLAQFEAGFETERMFDLIPRDRLASVNSTANTLVLALACDCRVAAFDVPGNFLALDIITSGLEGTRDVLPLEGQASETQPVAEIENPTPLIQPTTVAPILRQPEPDLVPKQLDILPTPFDMPAELTLPDMLTSGLTTPNAPDPPELKAIAPPSRATPFPLQREDLTPEAEQLLSEIQMRLAREVGTAATTGVIEARVPSALPTTPRPQINTSVFADELATAANTLPSALPSDQRSNIRISNSMDVPQGLQTLQERVSISGVVCPAPDTFELSGWSDDTPFHTQIGPLRRDLYGEFDRLNEMKAIDLAKTYLYFGFGAEALQVLTLDATLAKQEHLLVSMAEIFERGETEAGAPLRALKDCGGSTALWALMAHDAIPTNSILDPNDAILALNRLPVHLRRLIAPALSQKLLTYGDKEAAKAAMRSLERLPEKMQPDAQLAQARLSLDDGETEIGKEQLRDVIAAGSDPSPEALILLVEEKIAANQEVDAMTAALVEAYANELRDTELGVDLRRTHVLALMKSGQFDRAFDAVDRLAQTDEGLRNFMLRELVDAATDVVFLEHYFAQSEADVASLPRRDILAIGSRLLDLGFAQSAQDLIATLPTRPAHLPSRLLAARTALALQQPTRAKAELEQVEGAQADVMRAEALHQIGAHAEAYDLFERTDQTWNATQSAWLAEDWQTLTRPETPVFGPLVTLSETAPLLETDTNGMLARSAAMLEESGSARQLIQDVLLSPELTSPPEQIVE